MGNLMNPKEPHEPPEEEVSSKKSSSNDSRRLDSVPNIQWKVAEQDAFKRPKKQTLAEPFINPVIGGEKLSMVNGGEITSPFEVSQVASGKEITSPFEISPKPSQWNELGSAVIRQATDAEKSQLVMPGFLEIVESMYDTRKHTFCYVEDTLKQAVSKSTCQATEMVRGGGPYMNGDGSFKGYKFYSALEAGTVIYGRTETVHSIIVGDSLKRARGVFFSRCKGYVLKLRCFSRPILDPWKLKFHSEYLMQLSGVILDRPGFIYQVTRRMQCKERVAGLCSGDLKEARKEVTLRDIASNEDVMKWTKAWKNFSHILRSILKGLVSLNMLGYQHYDIKEQNILVNMPPECTCPSILECACANLAEIRINDFDTLHPISGPPNRKCGTKFYRPIESEALQGDVIYNRPTRDSWAVLIIMLHFCCGTAVTKSNDQMLEMPWLKNQECHYAKDRLLEAFDCCLPRLQPIAQYISSCFKMDYKERPTPQEMLIKWDILCDTHMHI